MHLNFKIQSLSFLIILILSAFNSSAQLIDKGTPASWSGKINNFKKNNVIKMPLFDLQEIIREDAVNDMDKSRPWRFGFNHEVNINPLNAGEWIQLKNGDRIWLLNILSPGAKSVNVIFDQFFIPEGAYLHMYNENKTHLVGAYTHILNNEAQILGTELVEGEFITLEYYEPAETKGKFKLNIGTITHGYRSLSLLVDKILKGLNDSGACNIDVLCPLGIGWENQIRSAGLIIVNGNSGCSGALINNTSNDGRPFFLTADHCLGNPSNWVFRFNWHSTNPSCATTAPSGNGPFFQSTFTSTLRARNAGSDFALVELNNTIPTNWGVYFAGWDRTDVAPAFTIGIHHPSGDIKKICKDDHAPTKAVDGAAQVWRINEWEHGVTEPGSSGSPLFDPSGRIIGQLYGGEAACLNSNSTQNNGLYDVYGRFAISWNGGSPASRLRDWLDPGNTGLMVLDGHDPSLSNFAIDVALINTGNPATPSCIADIVLIPSIRNLGSSTINSLQIEVRNGANIVLTYPWTGSLSTGEIISIELPAVNFPGGLSQLTMNILSPNGLPDENPQNNSGDFSVSIVENGINATFTLLTDCWGSEIAWGIADSSGTLIAEGGPYEDIAGGETIQQSICLAEGCYTFIIIDSYGDGLYGSQYNDCNVNGNYFLTDAAGSIIFQMTAVNGDFGDEAIHTFCIEGQALNPSFSASSQIICSGQSVQFEDNSSGDPISWLWSFPGGIPATSDNQNPSVTYHLPGTYAVTLQITDGQISESITIAGYITVNEVPSVSIINTSDFSSCPATCIGELLAVVTGGSTPYHYMWSNGSSSDQISDLCYAPSFSVIVTDAFGCAGDSEIEIVVNDLVILNVELDINCADSSACAQLLVSGVAEPYTVTWSTGETDTLVVCGFSSGLHSVTVADANGCSGNVAFTIAPFVPINITADITHTSCTDSCSGQIVTVVSGSGPLTYSWSNGSSIQDLGNLCPGAYSLTVTDNNGCQEISEFLIEMAGGFNVEFEVINERCLGECDGSITIFDITTFISYVWSGNFGNEPYVDNLCAGLYSVTVTNEQGCTRDLQFEITEGDEAPLAAFTASSILLDINIDPTVTFSNESQGAESYEWSFGDGTGSFEENPSHTYTETGEYLVVLSAINGSCIKTDSILILVDEMVATNSPGLYSHIQLFPNPAKELVSLKLNGNLIASSVEIIHMNGAILQKQVVESMNAFSITTANVPGGVYFVRIQTNEGVAVKKLIIQN